MTALAHVDALRALPPPRALATLRRLEAELGPEAVGALETAWDFWRRPAQRFPTALELATYSIVVIAGDYGAGKTHTALELLEHLMLTGRARAPRILAATGAAARRLVAHPTTGMLAWRKPGVTYLWEPSKGFEGELRINGVLLSLLSSDAPASALGDGADVQLVEDPIKCPASGRAAFVAALKSCRERGALTIVSTTSDGLAMLGDVLDELGGRGGVLVIDLGETSANRGNLSRNFVENIVPALMRAGAWNPLAGVSPWAQLPFPLKRLRLELCPPLVELAVSIDPNKGGACLVGIVGGGRDARSCIHVRHDRSGALDDGLHGWPAVAWDLAVQLQREHPGAPWHFVLESNVGKQLTELLRGEERARRMRGDPVPLPGGGWATGKSEVSVCDPRYVRADKDKCVRAVSPARLGAQEQVRFAEGLGELEGQLRDLTPAGTKSDRADAANHLINDLAGLADEKGAAAARAAEHQVEATRAAFVGLREAQASMPRPAFRAGRV